MRLLISILTVLAMATIASGAGTIGVYFDTDYSQNAEQVNPFEAFNIYVVLHGVDSGVSGVEYRLNLPANVAVTSAVYAGENPLVLDNATWGTAVGFGNCELALQVLNHDYVIVATLGAITLGEFGNSPITLSPYVNPQDQAAMPQWADCASGQNQGLWEVDFVENATLLSSSVPLDGASWGSVKSLFND